MTVIVTVQASGWLTVHVYAKRERWTMRFQGWGEFLRSRVVGLWREMVDGRGLVEAEVWRVRVGEWKRRGANGEGV